MSFFRDDVNHFYFLCVFVYDLCRRPVVLAGNLSSVRLCGQGTEGVGLETTVFMA